MIRKLAEFVLKGRQQAWILALIFSLLPFLGWLADVIMLLVTLRKGPKEGAFVLGWILLPSLLLVFKGYPEILIYNVLAGSVLVYGLAVLLRHTASWTLVLQIATLIGVVGVIVAHLILPNISQIWQAQITTYVTSMQKNFGVELNVQELQNWIVLFTKVATGFQVSLLLLGDVINLAIARWMQDILFNPGGLRQELYGIRVGPVAVGILVLTLILSFLGNAIGMDILPIVIFPFVLSALSVIHCVAAKRKLSSFWLFCFYTMWIFSTASYLFFYIIGLLVFIAVVDTGMNFRKYLIV